MCLIQPSLLDPRAHNSWMTAHTETISISSTLPGSLIVASQGSLRRKIPFNRAKEDERKGGTGVRRLRKATQLLY